MTGGGTVEAARLILLASHLLFIVEKRAAAKNTRDGEDGLSGPLPKP